MFTVFFATTASYTTTYVASSNGNSFGTEEKSF